MSLTYTSEFVFIGKGDESFLENYSYELSEDSGSKGGKIFMALEIVNNMAEAEDIGEAIFANFRQKFYENLDADPYERFEESLKEVNKTIEMLREEKVSRFIGNFNVAMGAIVGDALYISVAGDAEVYLVRKRFVSVVSEGLAEDSQKSTFINIANGTLEPSDRVLFSSSRLLRYITKGELGKIVGDQSSGGIGGALVELRDFIMTEILGRSALIGVEAHEQGTEEEEKEGDVLEEEKSWQPGHVASFFRKWLPQKNPVPGVTSLFAKAKGALAKLIPEKFVQKLPGRVSETLEAAKTSLQKVSGSKPSGMHMPREMKKEHILVLAIVLLVVLVAGTFWLRTRGNQQRAIQEQQVKLNLARDLVNEASTVGQFDKTKAAELLIVAETQTHEVLNSRFIRGEAVKMLDDIQKQRDSLDDVKRVTAPTLLADLSEKRGTVSVLGIISLKDRLYAFEYNALYEMVLDKLQDPLTISDIETVILGAGFPDQNGLLFLTRTGKMIEYIGARFAEARTKDGIWKKGVDMKTYNDKVYILDPERNQIWRYTRLRDTFDVGIAYNQDAELQKAVSLAIDSSIYVLASDGTITQLYQGQKQEYPLRRAPLTPLDAPARIFTSPDLAHLFVLEPSRNRVVLFRKDTKNGGAQYQTQYVFDKVGQLRDLAVADGRLYVMDDKKVYFVNLSGL